LESALKRSPIVNPIAGPLVHALASEVAPSAGSDEELGRALSERLGRPVALVHGAVAAQGSGYRLSFRANDARSNAEMASATADVANVDGVVPTIAHFAYTLRATLGDPPPPDDEGKMGLSLSLEADHEFAAGRWELNSGKTAEAYAHLDRALALDPHFAVAQGSMAVWMDNAGRDAEGEKFLRDALANADSLSARERLLLVGTYHSVRAEFGPAAAAYEELFTRWPTDTRSIGNLAVAYVGELDFGRALDVLLRARRDEPWSVANRSNLIRVHVLMNDFEAGAEEACSALADLPHPNSTAYAFGAIAQALIGRRDRASELLDRLREARPLAALPYEADYAAFEGRLADAAALLEKGTRDDEMRGARGQALAEWAMLAEVRLRRGDRAGAHTAATRAGASPEAWILYKAARVLLLSGGLHEGKALAGKIASHPGDPARLYSAMLAAEVVRAESGASGVIEGLKAALGIADAWLVHAELGAAYLESGQFEKAEHEFGTCISRKGEGACAFLDETLTASLLPPVLYGLARAKDALHKPDAAEAYEAFLAVDGSEQDPLVRDARQRMGKFVTAR
jgi:tetratricopeptide (TPR) repeat protein